MQKLAFGTDGIRGRVGDFPFTVPALEQLGLALGDWISEHYAKPGVPVKILLAGDTRESVAEIKKILSAGILRQPIIIVDVGVLPTPALLMLMKLDKTFSCGIMISASHNPFYDNGIKLFDAATGKLTAEQEAQIVKHFEAAHAGAVVPGQLQGILSFWHDAHEVYLQALLATVPARLAHDLTIVLDCAHGATYKAAPAVFRALGADVIVINDQPTGKNINEHAGALHPEGLLQAVVAAQAHLGFAFDGDGDRVVVVTRDGSIKDGDDIIALLLDLEMYAKTPAIVGTVMSNSGFEAFLKTRNIQLLRAAVGDKYVVELLEKQGLLLGGEPSGHIVLKNYLPSGDGILVALKVLEAVLQHQRWLLDYVTKYPQLIVNVPAVLKKDLAAEPCASILHSYNSMNEEGRILVRYSGTEPLLRVMVEGKDEAITADIAHRLAKDLQLVLNS